MIRRIRGKGRGCVLVPRDFLDLGSRQAVDRALARMAERGFLRRLAQGVYHYPEIHPRLGPLSPRLDRVARAIARSHGSTLQPSGVQVANQLGLSTQVPAQLTYLTDGTTRDVRVGNQTIRFRHTSPRNLLGAGTAAGSVVQALRFLGRGGVTEDVIAQLQEHLPARDKKQLASLAPMTPAWMQPALSRITEPTKRKTG